MISKQNNIINKKNKTITLENECSGNLYNTTDLYFVDKVDNLNEVEEYPLCLSYKIIKQNNDIINTSDITYLYSKNESNEYNMKLYDINETNTSIITSSKIFLNSLDIISNRIVDLYIKITVDSTTNKTFMDNQNQWIIDDEERYLDDKYIFDYLSIIESYEYTNIKAPLPTDMDELSKYDIDLFPDIVTLDKITFSLSQTKDDSKSTNLYLPAKTYTYDSLLYDSLLLNRLINRKAFVNMLSDIDATTDPGTNFSDIIDDIKGIIIDALTSFEYYVKLYGYNYSIYNRDTDELYATEDQFFNINTEFYITPATKIFIPNGFSLEDNILTISNQLDLSTDNNVSITDTYVIYNVFDTDTVEDSIINKEIVVGNLTMRIPTININQKIVPNKIIIEK